MNGEVDAVGLHRPDGSRDKEADLAGETRVLVLFNRLVLQSALHSVEAPGLPRHQGQHVHIWSRSVQIQHWTRATNTGEQIKTNVTSNKIKKGPSGKVGLKKEI